MNEKYKPLVESLEGLSKVFEEADKYQKLLSSLRAMDNILINMKQALRELSIIHSAYEPLLRELSNEVYKTEMAVANVSATIKAEPAVEKPIHLNESNKGSLEYKDR